MLDFIDDFRVKSRALQLLNELILWGDIEAVITVNYTEYFEKVFREVMKVDGAKGVKKGEGIYSEVKGQYEEKRKFYCEFLRCVQVWAECFPYEHTIFYDETQENQEATPTISPIAKHYRFLYSVRKFTFP